MTELKMIGVTISAEAQGKIIDVLPDDKLEAYAVLAGTVEACLDAMGYSIETFATNVQIIRNFRNTNQSITSLKEPN
jgi:hypothetical protein